MKLSSVIQPSSNGAMQCLEIASARRRDIICENACYHRNSASKKDMMRHIRQDHGEGRIEHSVMKPS